MAIFERYYSGTSLKELAEAFRKKLAEKQAEIDARKRVEQERIKKRREEEQLLEQLISKEKQVNGNKEELTTERSESEGSEATE